MSLCSTATFDTAKLDAFEALLMGLSALNRRNCPTWIVGELPNEMSNSESEDHRHVADEPRDNTESSLKYIEHNLSSF
jgi:hypothetical protein